jgi:ABC-type xylose transport system permease subunit
MSTTPKWFKAIRTIGLILTGIGTALVTAPISLPAVVVTLGGYLIVGGAVASAVATTATTDATQ